MYDTLKTNFDCKKKSTASEIKLLAFNDEDVQRLWGSCCIDMPTDESNEVVQQIIHEWLILRGHSLTSKYMEDYKKLTKQETKKKKGLCPQLKLN